MTLTERMGAEAADAIAAMQAAALHARTLHARAELMRHMATTARKALSQGDGAAAQVAAEWMAWAMDPATMDASARGFVDAHLHAARGAGDADALLSRALDALDAALTAEGTTLADEMAWRSECAHGWWGAVCPAPPGLERRASVPPVEASRPFWEAGCAPHCAGQ